MAMRAPRLVLVLDPERVPAGTILPDLAARAVAGGVDRVILRARGEKAAMLEDLATALLDRIGPGHLILNGNPDLAIRFGLAIHLPERGASLASLRERLGPDTLIGRSVHSPESAAASAGADYLVAGHLFASRSHPGQQPLGSAGFAAIAAATTIPVLAVGGITAARVGEALMAGAAGVAVVDAIATAPDPEAAARDLSRALAAAGTTDQPPFRSDA
jgi:thiamine-phosphate diphosphorylase